MEKSGWFGGLPYFLTWSSAGPLPVAPTLVRGQESFLAKPTQMLMLNNLVPQNPKLPRHREGEKGSTGQPSLPWPLEQGQSHRSQEEATDCNHLPLPTAV